MRVVLLSLICAIALGVRGIGIALTLPQMRELTRPAAPGAQTRAARPAAPAARAVRAARAPDDGPDWWRLTLLWTAAWTAAAPPIVGALLARTIRRRLAQRERRRYGLYELRLSMHDEAKVQDLEDMVEALHNLVCEFPEQRALHGQPYVAFELHYGPAGQGMEWTICVRCERDLVASVDGIVAAAYPDVRVGHVMGETPTEIDGRLPVPGYLMRFCKARAFIYSINTDDLGGRHASAQASPIMEAIAQAQASLGRPSSVRFQLTPAPHAIEAWARHRFERYENRLKRSELWGLPEAGTRSVLHQDEMRDARRTQSRAMFWLEAQVAAADREDANRIAAAMQARRGDNRLHRRWWLLERRHRLHRERFPDATPPLWPSPSLRGLCSSTEIAALLALPTARMKGVPVRRLNVPRLPAPPDVTRTVELAPPAPPGPGREPPVAAAAAVQEQPDLPPPPGRPAELPPLD